MFQLKDCGKCDISVFTTQKLCHKETTEICVQNNYSIILLHEFLCGHIEVALHTVIQISGETEHGQESQKNTQNILKHPRKIVTTLK